jgi:CheY-like chemotaxis protein
MTDSVQPSTGHALVIEDERDVLDLLDAHLGRLGYRVTAADSGELGVDLALAEPPDLVVVDMMLPGIDGREVVRRLRADPSTRDCSVVLCSVLDPPALDGIDADAVLAKPFGRAAIAIAVGEGTRRRVRRTA